MSASLQRGSVVLRGRRLSVVWDVTADTLVLLPVIVPRQPWRHDVVLDAWDLVVMGGSPAGSVVRPKRNPALPRPGHELVGGMCGATMCRVVHAVVRAIEEARLEVKLLAERRQRDNYRDERCVNLVGAGRR